LPRRREVTYETRFALRADLHLEGGLGSPIIATYVRDGGPAWKAGVVRGDVLQLGAGGHGDQAFLELPPMDALATLQGAETVGQPAKLVFEGPDISLDAKAAVAAAAPQPAKVGLLAAKTAAEPAPGGFELICEQEIWVSAGKPCNVPGVFVGRWVRLEFPQSWPKVDGQALLLSVKVMKVWRLAPPLFRQGFMEALRTGKRPGDTQRKPSRTFWASSQKHYSYNLKVNLDILRVRRRGHDFEGPEDFALEKVCQRDKKEFNVLRTDEMMALRHRIFAKEDDIRECTFHPRTASNVAPHVLAERERIARMDPETVTNIDDFVHQLGTDYKVRTYNNYWMVHRRHMLQKAKRDFVTGAIGSALTKLEGFFGVEQIMRHFKCHHEGCGMLLDQDAEVCACAGFYCTTHKPHAVHNCKMMKKKLAAKALRAKERENEMRERGEEPPPEEKFDNKVELGLILEVYALADQILTAKNAREAQKHNLEKLGHSLASFGAIRLLERPFKKQLCQTALNKRRTWTREGGTRTPLLGRRSSKAKLLRRCNCPKAHSPAELRFPAGESVQRRSEWIKEALLEADFKSDIVPGSSAERSKLKKEDRKKTKKDRSDRSGSRGRSVQRPGACLRRDFEDKVLQAQRARGMACEARAKLEDGDIAAARNQLLDAKDLASSGLYEVLGEGTQRSMAGYSLDEPEREAPSRASAWGLGRKRIGSPRAQRAVDNDALFAVEDGRALRECERHELQELRASAEQEARKSIEYCLELEDEIHCTELFHQQQQRQRQPPVILPGGGYPEAFGPEPVHMAADDEALKNLLRSAGIAAGEFQGRGNVDDSGYPRRGKSEMCADFLETGRCKRGAACPNAHHPSELDGIAPSWSLERRYDQMHFTSDVAEVRLRADQIRAQEAAQRQAACTLAVNRSIAADDDLMLKGLMSAPRREAAEDDAVLRDLLASKAPLAAAAEHANNAKDAACPKCATVYLDDSIFCRKCGQKRAEGVVSFAPVAAASDRRRMCGDYLDSGSCSMGENCPFAHHPSQLLR